MKYPINTNIYYVSKTKAEYNRCSPILTHDASAAISFFSCFNDTLRSEKRHALKKYFQTNTSPSSSKHHYDIWNY